MSLRCIAGMTLALSFAAAPALAQSLGDVARAEEARRTTAPKAKKVYSNADLGPGGVPEAVPPPPPPADCYVSKQSDGCVPPEAVVENSEAALKALEEAPKEGPIRAEADTIRGELARLQAEINQLQAQQVDQSLTAARRQAATDMLAMRRGGFEGFQRRWARLEKQVRDYKLPHAWIEPVPDNVIGQQ